MTRLSRFTSVVKARATVPPSLVLLVGVLTAVVWIVALNFMYDLSEVELVLLLTTGAMGSAGASLSTLALNFAARADRREQREVEHAARHDTLTGLLNRAELFRILDESLEVAKREDMVLGVLFLDLDRFKVVNDTMGHDAGDDLLRTVADRLRATVRNTDVVARLGGDEFVVVCRDLLSGDSVVSMAGQILKAFKAPVDLNGREQIISSSIGIAIATPDDTRAPDDLVRDADSAMYRAKETKSGYAVFDEAHRRLVLNRLDIERDLTRALEEDEFVVYYQPIVNVADKMLYGFEALVRWNHPERGLLGPGDFLKVAEDAGMMSEIGQLVLREACAQAAVWNHINPTAKNIRMSVNVAEQQLADPVFPHKVQEVLAWSGLDPSQLVLEILEDVIIDHLDGLGSLRDLRALGVHLAIDDFGTKHSSLAKIKEFDMVSTIKIDQTFVRDMRTGEADRAIIEAVVVISNALDLNVVAEGVEFHDQMEQLEELGVSLMQGYLFNTPVAPEVIDPDVWFPSRTADRTMGLKPVEVSHSFTRQA